MYAPRGSRKERAWRITVRHAEPKDYEALHRIFSGPRAIVGTLQLSLPSEEAWRERLAEPLEGLYSLVGCVEGEVVGNLGLHTSPSLAHAARRQHRYGRARGLGGQGRRARRLWRRRWTWRTIGRT